MTTEAVATPTTGKVEKKNGQSSGNPGKQSRVISSPNDVASVVLMQIDAVNAKKDDLTIAIKGLTDTTKQLVRAYAEHAKAIQKLQQRITQLEAKDKE
jgi:glycerol-3-phosphate dehydrogenase